MCRTIYNQRHLKSASVMPASSLQCAPYVLAQKAPETDKGLFWWNWISFSVLDSLRRCRQIPQAIPNHYLGVWWVVYLKYLIKAKQYCSQQHPYEKVFLNIPEIQPWFPPRTEEIFRNITLISQISARHFGWSLCPTNLKHVKPHKDLLPPTTAQNTNKVHTYSLEL